MLMWVFFRTCILKVIRVNSDYWRGLSEHILCALTVFVCSQFIIIRTIQLLKCISLYLIENCLFIDVLIENLAHKPSFFKAGKKEDVAFYLRTADELLSILLENLSYEFGLVHYQLIVLVYVCRDRFMVCNDMVDSLTEWLFGPRVEKLLGHFQIRWNTWMDGVVRYTWNLTFTCMLLFAYVLFCFNWHRKKLSLSWLTRGQLLLPETKQVWECLRTVAIVVVTIDRDNCSRFAHNEFYRLLHLYHLISK